MADIEWRIEGDYYESCNCNPGCPCIFNSPPTKSFCVFLFAFDIRRGHYGDARLDGTKAAGMIHSPGNMWEGNYTQALYIDAACTQEQRKALEVIFTGAAGGSAPFTALFGDLVAKYLGAKDVPIEIDSQTHKVSIPEIMDFDLEYLKSVTGKIPRVLDADFIPEHKVGRAVSSTYTDHDTNRDNTGGHAFISTFELYGP